MALRLIEMVLREKDCGEVRELLKEHKVLEHRQVRLADGGSAGADFVGSGTERGGPGALGEELTESYETVASYGGVGAESTPMHHGHGGKKDEADIDAERFFRAIDRAVLEHHSRPSGLPLMLAA